MPESSSRSFPTVPTALSALTAQSMTPDAPLPHPPSLGAGALLRWLLRRAAVPVTLATLAACTSNIIQAIVPAFLGQALDAGIENGLNGRVWGIGALLLVLFVVYAVGDTMLSYFGVTAWMRTAFDRRRRTMVEMLSQIEGLTVPVPRGAFYAYPSIEGLVGRTLRGTTIDSSATLAALILEHAEVAIVPGEAFGPSGFVRLSYALGDDDLVEGVGRVQKLLAEVE